MENSARGSGGVAGPLRSEAFPWDERDKFGQAQFLLLVGHKNSDGLEAILWMVV